MIVTVATALELAPEAIKLVQQLITIISTNATMTVDEEIIALLKAKMKSSGDMVTE